MGAVMGSKNLKAIAVRGTRPPQYYNPKKVYELVTKLHKDIRLHKAQHRRWGHSWSIPERYYKTTEGVKNKQLGWDPICDLHNPLIHEQGYGLWNNKL